MTTVEPSLRVLPGGMPERTAGQELIRPYTWADATVVARDLLPVIRDSYPKADRWLAGRLDEVLAGRARCNLARDLHGVRGLTIETPKGRGRLKLSTIWVAERMRRQGLGQLLLAECEMRWLRDDLEEVWLTASSAACDSIAPLLIPRGFELTTVEEERYREGWAEAVFHWSPERAWASLPMRLSA